MSQSKLISAKKESMANKYMINFIKPILLYSGNEREINDIGFRIPSPECQQLLSLEIASIKMRWDWKKTNTWDFQWNFMAVIKIILHYIK